MVFSIYWSKHLKKKRCAGDFSFWEKTQAEEENVLHYKPKYLEILSSHWLPSEEFTLDIVDSRDQLDFSVLQIAREKKEFNKWVRTVACIHSGWCRFSHSLCFFPGNWNEWERAQSEARGWLVLVHPHSKAKAGCLS